MRQLVSVNVATMLRRATELKKASSDSGLSLADLRAIMRDEAGLLACQADLCERVASFEGQRV